MNQTFVSKSLVLFLVFLSLDWIPTNTLELFVIVADVGQYVLFFCIK